MGKQVHFCESISLSSPKHMKQDCCAPDELASTQELNLSPGLVQRSVLIGNAVQRVFDVSSQNAPIPRDVAPEMERPVELLEASPIDVQTLQEKVLAQQKRLDVLCASVEAREAVTANISLRLQKLEEKQFLPAQAAVDWQALQNTFHLQQERQEHQAEKIATVVKELEQLFTMSLKCDLEDKVNSLQAWADQQVQALQVELGEIRSGFDKCLPLGTLVRDIQTSVQSQGDLHKQVTNDIEKLQQNMTVGSDLMDARCFTLESRLSDLDSEKDRLRGEIRILENTVTRMDRRLESFEIKETNPFLRSQIVGLDTELDSEVQENP